MIIDAVLFGVQIYDRWSGLRMSYYNLPLVCLDAIIGGVPNRCYRASTPARNTNSAVLKTRLAPREVPSHIREYYEIREIEI